MHLKELLQHRSSIVKQVEESYDELDRVIIRKRIKHESIKLLNKEINEKNTELNEILNIKNAKFHLMKHIQAKIDKVLLSKERLSRIHRKQIIYHYSKTLEMFTWANRKAYKRFNSSSSFSIAIKNFIIQERKRKKREIKRQKNKYEFNKVDFSSRLNSLFYMDGDDTGEIPVLAFNMNEEGRSNVWGNIDEIQEIEIPELDFNMNEEGRSNVWGNIDNIQDTPPSDNASFRRYFMERE